MNSDRTSPGRFRNQEGVAAVLVVVVLIILIGFAAMAVDVGYYMVTRNELQNIADATALWGARELGHIYQGLDYAAQQSYVCDPGEIIPGVQEVALDNYAGGLDGISVSWDSSNTGDIRIGQWTQSTTPHFTPTLNQPDAVTVTTRREAGANGPISSIFAKVFAINTFDVRTDATAALTGQGESKPGELELPVGISAFFFDGYGCNDWVKFSPTNDPDSCAGWTSWEYGANDANLRRILQGALDEWRGVDTNDYPSPETVVAEDTSNFIGGDLSTNTFNEMMNLYRERGYDYDPATGLPIQVGADGNPVLDDLKGAGVPLYEEDGVTPLYYPADPRDPDTYYHVARPRNYHKWETLVIVYDWHDCSNPNTAIVIAGYATIILTDVLGPPDKLLRGQIVCELVSNEDNRGGGGDYGTKGSIPSLVE